MFANQQDTFDNIASSSISRLLEKYSWLIDLSRKHGVSTLLFQEIIEFLNDIGNFKKEKDGLSIGLVLENKRTNFEPPFINQNIFHLSNLSNFIKLDSIIDGKSQTYLVNTDGNVQIGQIPQALRKQRASDTLQNVSLHFQTVTFSIGKPISSIYDTGTIIKINKEGIWLRPCAIKLDELSASGYSLCILNRILNICLKMSNKNKGCTFVITKDNKLVHCSPMLSDCQFSKCNISQLHETEIMKMAALDGALIVNTDNEVIGVGQRLVAPSSASFVKESGRGSRHDSAASYSGAVDCVAFVVSENGPITVFFKGKKIARCYEELFGYK